MRQVYVEGWGLLALPALSSDLRHVTAGAADPFAALLAGPPGFGRGKLVRRPALVGGTSALRGNLSLTLLAHAGKTTAAAGRPASWPAARAGRARRPRPW